VHKNEKKAGQKQVIYIKEVANHMDKFANIRAEEFSAS
jgi:hypothetical protein